MKEYSVKEIEKIISDSKKIDPLAEAVNINIDGKLFEIIKPIVNNDKFYRGNR